MRQCRDCHNRAERVRRAVRRNRLNRRQTSKLLTAIKNQRSDLGVKALCRDMAARFGGVDGIVEKWHRSLDADLPKGGYAAFRHLAAIIRLSQYCERNKPDYGAMTDDELEQAIIALGGTVNGEQNSHGAVSETVDLALGERAPDATPRCRLQPMPS